jgi:hypothetical protein
MKYRAQLNRVIGLARQLPGPGTTIVITGGLPPDSAPAKPQPPGGDLKHQHALITRAAAAPKAPEAVPVKIVGRGS